MPAAVPRRDHHTVAGSQAISVARLAAHHHALATAAAHIRGTLSAAAAVPHPDPRVAELAELADRLHQHADDLETVREAEIRRQSKLRGPRNDAGED